MNASPTRWNQAPLSRRGFLVGAAAVGVTVALPGMLAGCAPDTATGTTTIEFWDMPWGAEGYEQAARDLAARYEAENPDVRIAYTLVPWATFYEVFSTAVVSGTTPDVSTGAPMMGSQYGQVLAPLDDYLASWEQEGIIDDLIPGALENQRDPSGSISGLPWNADIRVATYNERLFSERGATVPTTFDELREAARRLTGDGVSGFGMAGVGPGGYQTLVSLMINNGGGLFDSSGEVRVLTDRNRETCELIQAMVVDGSISSSAAALTQDDVRAGMRSGSVGIIISNPNYYAGFDNEAEIQVLPPLTGYHGDRGALTWSGPIRMFEASTRKDQTAHFMGWWVNNMSSLFGDGRAAVLPSTLSLYSEVDTLSGPRMSVIVDEYFPVGRTLAAPYEGGLLPYLNQVEGAQALPTLAQDVLSLRPVDDALAACEDALGEIVASY